jgi:PAS domain S-box-containing protein
MDELSSNKCQVLTQYANAIIDTLQEPLLIIDKDLKVLFASAAFYSKFFVSEEETKSKKIYDLGDGQWNIPELKKLLEEILPHEVAVHDYKITHKFPKIGTKTMQLNARKLIKDDDASEVIFVVIGDITEREEAEHKLLISEVRYRKLFETAKDGILLIDPVTEEIIDANPFLLEIIGYTLDEVLKKKLWEIGAIKDVEAIKEIFQELQTNGYVRYEDLPIQAKDGTAHEVEFVSNRYPIDGMQMIQCNIRDITARKIAEKKAATYLDGIEKLNKMMVGREVRMSELKKEIRALEEKIKDGLPATCNS